MAKLFVCKICGEPYIGNTAPDDCPFCGAPKNYLKDISEYSELWKTELTEQERKDMKETLNLEVNATAYYKKVCDINKKYSKANRLYKQFARVELEHADIAAKFLKIEVPELVGEEPKGSYESDIERTKNLEQEAVKKYKGFLKNAKNPNVKNLYVALIHAEEGHYEIAESEI
jgi:rubrerythrin